MRRAEDLSTTELCDEVERLHARRLDLGTPAALADMAWLARGAAPVMAPLLREAEQELRELAALLDLGPAGHVAGEIAEAVEALQRRAARATELERLLAQMTEQRDLLRCDLARGQVS